jgi:glycosyltransferase involved in cell wall biosynthesis
MKLQVEDAQLWIVGDGDLRGQLENLAMKLGVMESVTFFGEQMDVWPFLASADLFVLSSVTEGIPISLLEALEAGLPAVVTNVGGMREVAAMTDAVLAVQASDPVALAAAMVAMAKSRTELTSLGEKARSCYQKQFTLERMASEYMTLYQHKPGVAVQIPLRSS